jgi:hypothetical protein
MRFLGAFRDCIWIQLKILFATPHDTRGDTRREETLPFYTHTHRGTAKCLLACCLALCAAPFTIEFTIHGDTTSPRKKENKL